MPDPNDALPPGRAAVLLRIYLSETDRRHGAPLYERIVRRALELGLAGATVLRGPMGYGRHSRIHTAKILRLADDLPIVVEIVDERAAIERLLADFGDELNGVTVTMETVRLWQA